MANKFSAGQQVKVIGNEKDDFFSLLSGTDLFQHAVPNGQVVTVIEFDDEDGQVKVDTRGVTLLSEHARPEHQWIQSEFVEIA